MRSLLRLVVMVRGGNNMAKLASAIGLSALVALLLVVTSTPASAHWVPVPCDFITGGGFVFRDIDYARANFGSHGGCKNGGFWGHVNYVDHGGGVFTLIPYHVDSIEIHRYLFDSAFPQPRHNFGLARD